MITIAKYSNTIEYKLKTTLDSSGVSKLQSELRQVQNQLKVLSEQKIISDSAAAKARDQIESFSKSLSKSFNSKLGMIDLTTLSKQMKENKTSLGQLANAYNLAGTQGKMYFNNLLGGLTKIDTSVKTVSKSADKLLNTLGNTARWGVTAGAFQTIANKAREAVDYVKELDESLTNIMMVTDYSKSQMNEYAKSANEAAKALGSTTTAMTNASLVYTQQGKNFKNEDKK